MQSCAYTDYETTFLLARGAVAAGDWQALYAAVDRDEDDASVSRAMAVLLATTDARRGLPKRAKVHVCRMLSAFCRCHPTSGGTAPRETA